MILLLMSAVAPAVLQRQPHETPGTPAPPPAPRRSGPPPQYDARCHLVDREGGTFRLNLQVRGGKTSRRAVVRSSEPHRRSFEGLPTLTTTEDQDWGGRWSQTDTMLFARPGEGVVLEVTVQDWSELGKVEVRKGSQGAWEVPMQLGLCKISFVRAV